MAGNDTSATTPQLRDWFDLPAGLYEGANRYETDDESVLSVWRDGRTWDLRQQRLVKDDTCTHRTCEGKGTYSLTWHCYNCGAGFLRIITLGHDADRTECPRCEVSGGGQR